MTVRGVINSITVPVPEAFELGPDQEGYFLFTADAYTVSVEDDGKTTAIRAQTVFHLTPSDEKGSLSRRNQRSLWRSRWWCSVVTPDITEPQF